ncbi:condensation domain-containing protein [Plantactinospora sp. BB1]|uniref:condensation domain-containing protein n=1 Tax=Plantactinospora sp. BB1 TaxID=2071627 RepID=UPI000D174AF8|nr:condensation domain-containing protein [Plantactinospora sp. BB1]AVT35236.1 condensation protein [Plantactinospora sp. BB1]
MSSGAPTPLALAPSQETVWEFTKYFAPDDPGQAKFNVVQTVELDVDLDSEVLAAALADVAARHDSLRTRFLSTGCDPWVRVDPAVEPPLRVVDLRDLAGDEQERDLAELAFSERYRDFDLLAGPLWQVTLVRLAADRNILLVCMFHVIADGWSISVFLDDLDAAYRTRSGLRPPQPPPVIGFQEVAERQRRLRDRTNGRAAYWRAALTPLPGPLPFPVEHRSTDLQGEGQYRFSLPPEVADAVRAVATTARTTPFTVLLAAYHLVLAGRTGQRRLVLGSTTLGRDTPDSTGVIGQFTTNIYLPLSADPGRSFLEHVATAHRANVDALRHAASFTEIADAVNPTFRQQRPWPFIHLFDAWFQSAVPARGAVPEEGERATAAPPDGGVESVRPEWSPTAPPERIPLWIRRGAPGVVIDADRRGGVLLYNPSFFRQEMVAELVGQYQSAVATLAVAPTRPVGPTGLL